MRRKYAKLSIGADVLQQSYELLHGFSIIPHRYEDVPIWKTFGTPEVQHGS